MKPVFIIGTGYSGTSILYKMLAMHPDFAWFSQYSLRGGDIPGRFRLPFYQYFNRILRLIFSHPWEKEEGPIKIIPRSGEAHQIWEYVFPKYLNLSREEYINRLKKVLEAEYKDWGKKFILTKSIRFRKYLPIIESIFPQAKFIHIIRDGRAITISRKYKGSDKKPTEIFVKRATAWAEAIEKINQQKGKIDMFELRYEDFCTDIRGYLKKILEFAGLDIKKFPFNKCPKTLDSTNEKWFKMATSEEIALFGNIQKEILKKYGYL